MARRHHSRAHDRQQFIDQQLLNINEMMNAPGTVCELIVVRGDGEDQAEGTFSMKAMDDLDTQLMLWIASRVMRSWNETHTPPQQMYVTIDVQVS